MIQMKNVANGIESDANIYDAALCEKISSNNLYAPLIKKSSPNVNLLTNKVRFKAKVSTVISLL